ncbi:Uncharacterised protein [Salmonella enterica subsp. enterica serovar Bovismorbificans]|nr:Uncharacterised protein [Salmonella enterica subsp. enterica serovar Bovismorbificans]CPR64136.1 Uncharacterised protein [Salmonella enterica subsp. enterica serovar Bovismorbificans]
MDKANGAQPLGENARRDQQHHNAGKRIRHAAISHFQAGKHILRVETAHEFQHGGQQHTDHQNGNNVQLRPPFTVKNQYADNGRERQKGIKRRGRGGNLRHVQHLM